MVMDLIRNGCMTMEACNNMDIYVVFVTTAKHKVFISNYTEYRVCKRHKMFQKCLCLGSSII